jgi:hypothetical protein
VANLLREVTTGQYISDTCKMGPAVDPMAVVGCVRKISRIFPQAFSTFLEACKINFLQNSYLEQKRIREKRYTRMALTQS